MDINRLIVEYPNAVPDKLCSHVIEYHEELESQGETHKGTFGYTDKFDNKIALKEFISSQSFESSPDGINLLQQYIHAPSNTIVRMEFVGSKFIYAVEVDTSEGFELCPADECLIDSNCPTGTEPKFSILRDFEIKNLAAYEAFLADNDIGIAAIEIILDKDGVIWTYDVNTNTNYNSAAEELAKKSAPLKIAKYLYSLQS